MSLILKTPWTRQPQGGSQASSAGLAQGLTSLLNAARPFANAAGGSFSSGDLEFGVAHSGVKVTAATISGFVSSPTLVSGDRTVAAYFLPAAVAGTKVLFTSTVGSGVAYWIGISTESNWSIGGVLSAGASTVTVGVPQLIVATKRGSTHSIYINGVFKASTTTALADGASGFTWLRFGSGTGNTCTSAVGALHMGATWSRALSDSEIANLHTNPWQLFAPLPRRIWAPGAAGPTTHATDGALTGPGASAAGAAVRFRAFATSGVLAGQSSAVAGAAARAGSFVSHDNTGALVGTAAVVAGSAARAGSIVTHDTTGALIGLGAAVAGAATRISVYPDPSVVLAGVQYGPGGIYVGTLTGGLSETRISLRSFTGRF